jgi:TM2 domain-containing membrane protein YozV
VDTRGAVEPPYHPQAHPAHLRASDAQRDAVAEMVRAAVTDGRLDLSECDARLDAVYAARTHGDLAGVIGDLQVYQPPRPSYPPVYYAQAVPPGVSERKILPAFLLCLFLGPLGIHRFYAGKTGSGLAMLLITVLTIGFGVIVTGVWALVDLIVLATGSFRDDAGNRMRDWG